MVKQVKVLVGVCTALVGLWPGLAHSVEQASPVLRAQSDGEAAASNYTKKDPNSLTSIPIKCNPGNKRIYGVAGCEDGPKGKGFLSQVESVLKGQLAAENGRAYRGLTTDYITGASKLSPTPVCNLTAGEENTNWLTAPNNGCGTYCYIRVTTFFPDPNDQNARAFSAGIVNDGDSCEREQAWFRGAIVQVRNYYKEQVLSEFRSKNLQLVDVDGVRPCAPAAADVLANLESQEDLSKRISTLVGEKKADEAECTQGRKIAEDAQKGKVVDEVFQNDPTSQAVCSMSVGSKKVISLTANLLGCEVKWRSFKTTESEFSNQQKWIDEGKNAIKPICEGPATCAFCTDADRSRAANECYRREIPKYLKEKLKRFNTNSPVELPKQTNAADAESLLFFAAIGMIRRRSKKNTGSVFMNRDSIRHFLMGGVLLVMASLSACDCNPNDHLSCNECQPPVGSPSGLPSPLVAQPSGCIYKTCMNTKYICTWAPSKSESKSINETVASAQDSGKTVCFRSKDENKPFSSDAAAANALSVGFRACTFSLPVEAAPPNPDGKSTYEMAGLVSGCEYLSQMIEKYNVEKVDTAVAQADCRVIAGLSSQPVTNFRQYDAPSPDKKLPPSGTALFSAMEQDLHTGKPSCSADVGPKENPTTMSGPLSTAAQSDFMTTRQIMFGTDLGGDDKNPTNSNHRNSSNLTAQTVGGPHGGGKGGAGARMPSSTAGGFKAPDITSTGGGAGGSGNEHGAFGSSTNDAKPVETASQEKESAGTQNIFSYETAASRGSAGKKDSGGGFASLFGGFGLGGAGSGSGAGGNGVRGVNFGSAAAGAPGPGGLAGGTDADFDGYLARVGSTSLFEVVNRRMDKWGSQLEAERVSQELRR